MENNSARQISLKKQRIYYELVWIVHLTV
jgi:hypothetical protein